MIHLFSFEGREQKRLKCMYVKKHSDLFCSHSLVFFLYCWLVLKYIPDKHVRRPVKSDVPFIMLSRRQTSFFCYICPLIKVNTLFHFRGSFFQKKTLHVTYVIWWFYCKSLYICVTFISQKPSPWYIFHSFKNLRQRIFIYVCMLQLKPFMFLYICDAINLRKNSEN